MKKYIVRVIILSVVVAPLCAMSAVRTIDDMPALCVDLLSRCGERPIVSDGAYDDIPRYYSVLPALGECCGQKVLPLDTHADRCLARVVLLLSSNAFAYRCPSVVVLASQDVLKLPFFVYLRDYPLTRLRESFERIIHEVKTEWMSVRPEPRMFLPIAVAALPDQWSFFCHKKTGFSDRIGYLRCLDRLIGAVADFCGISSDIYFCSESWKASYGFLPTSPCSSPLSYDDGQCYLCVRKDALEQFDRVFGFNLAALPMR